MCNVAESRAQKSARTKERATEKRAAPEAGAVAGCAPPPAAAPASQPAGGARARPPAHPPAASAAGLREAGREARECTATSSRGLLGCFGWGAGASARFFYGTLGGPAGRCPWGRVHVASLDCPFFIVRDFAGFGGETAGGKKLQKSLVWAGAQGLAVRARVRRGRGGHVAHHRGAPHRARASSLSFPPPTPAGARLSTGSGLRGARVAGADHSPGRAGRHRGRLAAQLGLARTRAASDGRGK